RPVAFLEGRLIELAGGAEVSAGIADHAGGLSHVFQHRVRIWAACFRPGCHTVIWVWHGTAPWLGLHGPGKSVLARQRAIAEGGTPGDPVTPVLGHVGCPMKMSARSPPPGRARIPPVGP